MPGAQTPIQPALLLARLMHQAAAHPTRLALVLGDRGTTYGELLALIATQGEALKSLIQPGERVAVAMDNCTELAVAIYAIWWAGGVARGPEPRAQAGRHRAAHRGLPGPLLLGGPA